VVERRVLWGHLRHEAIPPHCDCQSSLVFQPNPTSRADPQTKSGELTNNLIAGTVGGFVGTVLNTPCASISHNHSTAPH
jgi:hypothetical protein